MKNMEYLVARDKSGKLHTVQPSTPWMGLPMFSCTDASDRGGFTVVRKATANEARVFDRELRRTQRYIASCYESLIYKGD